MARRISGPYDWVCKECSHSFKATDPRPRVYCSKICAGMGLAKAMHADPETYIKIGNTRRGTGAGKTYTKRGGRHEHRVVAEEKIGRRLMPGEIVHHRDHNKKNNDPENLDIMASLAEHTRLHATGRKVILKTHCSKGHEFNEKNTKIRSSDGCRICISCAKDNSRLYHQKLRDNNHVKK